MGKKKDWGRVTTKCWMSHDPLVLPGGKTVLGGSCVTPITNDADIYIGFAYHMQRSMKGFPWEDGHEIYYPVADQHAPKWPAQFKKMVLWTLAQIDNGKTVHVGCIGGHGRTGVFLAALVSKLGEKDAIAYVRENYCNRAVETKEQVDWLVEHFKVKGAEVNKRTVLEDFKGWGDVVTGVDFNKKGTDLIRDNSTGDPINRHKSIWGE